MLKLVSWFVLEVLPYMLSAVIAAIVVPGFLMSQLHGKSATASNRIDGAFPVVELVHDDGTLQTLSPRLSRAVKQLVPK